jgi:TIR domain
VSDKPVIFISYSHRDRAWLDYVRSFFEPFAEHWNLQIWDDTTLRIGDDWRGDIYSAIDAACVFILLVSRYALSSTFILKEEAERAWQRPRSDVQFCPLVVTPYSAPTRPWLDQPNRRPRDGKALSELPDHERDREMATIAKHVDEIIKAIAVKTIGKVVTPLTPEPPATTRPAFPSIVDYGRLPETPYKKLVGRGDELRRLDGAWADQKTRVISLVAWGGAGKTSLVMEWLTRFRDDGYRGADAVLCWSFYSQGTQERAAAGEGLLDWALGKLKVEIHTTSSTAKGERLAEELSRRRVLLVLDGLEPLQYGPEGQQGALKDPGLRAFLRALAVKQPQAGHSLVVITSRLPVRDLQKWEDSTTPRIDLWRLADEAGAALLAGGGVTGTPDELRAATHDFAGHALALSLLAGFLKLLHGGDVHARSGIRPVTDDPSGAGQDQALRVIEAFDNAWLAGEPILRAIMFVMGLFDRPAQTDWIKALRANPVIEGLTDAITHLDDGAWRAAIARLRAVKMLDLEDSLSPDALDAHPLVRQWFGERFKATNETAWRAAHNRLYEHFRDVTKEGDNPTLEDLTPLYQAIAHGCRAGRYEEVIEKVYKDRICKRVSDTNVQFYSQNKLGAFGTDLVALSWFFERPFEVPAGLLSELNKAWVIASAAYCLRAQGRYREALILDRTVSLTFTALDLGRNAAILASNRSSAELLLGNVSQALSSAAKSVEYSDLRGDGDWMMLSRTAYAAALHSAGERGQAEALFIDAEHRQTKIDSREAVLYSLRGYQFCDLLMEKMSWYQARSRAVIIINSGYAAGALLDVALGTLAFARANISISVAECAPDAIWFAQTAVADCLPTLQQARFEEYMPLGFLARSTFRRSVGDWDGAARDLDEVEEIAEPGPMRLYLCDMALERARLAFAKIEACAPLNEMLEKDNPAKPEVPSAEEIAKLKGEAEKQIRIADDYIQTCGYHRRDEELAELKAVLKGEKTFASLPPRV